MVEGVGLVDGGTSSAHEASILLALLSLPRVGPAKVGLLCRAFGSAARAWRAPAAAFGRLAGEGAARARREPGLLEDVARRVDTVRARGVTVLTWSDRRYPDMLRHLSDPPPVLFLKGDLELLEGCVAVVGARRATERGRDVAHRLGRALASRGVPLCSGMALGVDGAAHRGALERGPTVAVLGTGIDIAYPRAHRRLYEQIGSQGLLVSEFEPGQGALPHHFPRRNRIIAALARVLVVVEAGRRSGSLITVDHALDLGREIWAVPGPIDVPTCAGSNRLLTDGARPLISVNDFLLDVLGVEGGANIGHSTAPTAEVHARSGVEGRVLEELGGVPVDVDELAKRLTMDPARLVAVLTTLEIHGEVERLPGMRFRRAA